jgi:hypothetical protein
MFSLAFCHRAQATHLTSLKAAVMGQVQEFGARGDRDADERFTARVVGVSIAVLFGLIVILHAISS